MFISGLNVCAMCKTFEKVVTRQGKENNLAFLNPHAQNLKLQKKLGPLFFEGQDKTVC